jgi:hypothetical protein
VYHEGVVGWNLAAPTEEDAKAAENLRMELTKERAHLDEECTADKVEKEAAWSQEAMDKVLNTIGKEDQDLCQIEEVVGRRHQGKKEGGLKGKTEETELGRGRQGQGRTPNVNLTVQVENLQLVLAKPEGGRGKESSTIPDPSGRHDLAGFTSQGRQESNHVTGKGGDVEVRVLSSE